MRRSAFLAMVLAGVCAAATILVAFCPNDGWGGTSSHITTGLTYCKMNITATSNIQHLAPHPLCSKRFYAQARFHNNSCTSLANSVNHSSSGSGTYVSSTKTCTAVAEVLYSAVGSHWTDDGNSLETQSSSSLMCPPLSQCQNPPETCPEGEEWHGWYCECQPISPIILDLGGDGFELTHPTNGVHFDLNHDGTAELISWTSASSNDGFLVLDRDRNQTINNGSELFGNYTPSTGPMSPATSNGFEALASLEADGARQALVVPDGVIDSADASYAQLRVWIDANHNGVSEPTELRSLASSGVISLDLNYRKSGRRDRYGNEFKLRAISYVTDVAGRERPRPYFDVYLRTP